MTYVSTVLGETGLVGFWELAESAGTTATDQTGNQNGTYTNVSGITFGQTGIPGGGGATATRFTAANTGYVSIPDVAAQRVGQTFTIEVWAKAASFGSARVLFTGQNTESPLLWMNNSNIVEGDANGARVAVKSSATITDTNYHYIVWTCGGGLGANQHLYIDGVEDTTNTGALNSYSSGTWSIGRNSASFDGTLAMAALYSVALTPTQITNHYTLGSAGTVANHGFLALMTA